MSVTERPSTLDQFGSRKRVIPAEAAGPLRKWRTGVYWVLLLIFLALPWIKINGLQAILLDIPGRRFEIFGILFLSHDAPLIFFLLILFALVLVLVTALWGRVWCGWACPQTVFIDAVYRRIEILVEGNYIERRKLHARAMGFTKARKLATKWLLFFLVSSLIAHSVIAYFSGGERLLQMIQGPPSESATYFLLVLSVTAFLMFNFGWFREQFCIIMCPYGRLQSALMDQSTVTVMYDEKRGEPRKFAGGAIGGALGAAAMSAARGDCVSCNRCVEVCPTGIDIRNGTQMECIACTACIDACNVIMRKVNKPEGLIRHKRPRGESPRYFRSRVVVYYAMALFLIIAFGYNLAVREPFSLTVHRAKDIPYQVLQEQKVLNHFKAHLMNQSLEPQEFEILLSREERARGVEITQVVSVHPVAAGHYKEAHFFIVFPRTLLSPKGEAQVKILVRERKAEQERSIGLTAVGPYSSGS